MSTTDPNRRIPHVDGIRGYLIYSMTLSHITAIGPNLLTPLSHKSLAVFFTGEGFMVLSGLMIGYIFLRPVRAEGPLTALARSLRRSWKIARYYIAVYALCVLPALVVEFQGSPTLVTFFRDRDPTTAEAFGLFLATLYRPLMFDILFLYILFIALAPLMIGLVLRWGAAWLVAASVGAWLLVQYGLIAKGTAVFAALIGQNADTLFGNFSIFSWQLLFVLGLLLGLSVADERDAWSLRIAWLRTHVLPVALAICGAFAALRLMTTAGVISIRNLYLEDYLVVDPLTLLNFGAFVVVLVCLLASEQDSGVLGRIGRWLAWLLNLGPLRVIGANSLLTFSASVVLTYWAVYLAPVLAGYGPKILVNTGVTLAIFLALYALARAHSAWGAGRGQAAARPEGARPSE